MRVIATQNSHSINEMNVVASISPSEHALGRGNLRTIFWYRCLHKPRLLRRTTARHGDRGRLERRISHTISLFSKGCQHSRREIGGCPVVTIRVRLPYRRTQHKENSSHTYWDRYRDFCLIVFRSTLCSFRAMLSLNADS